ncbi:MAG: HAD family hydrolase [Candidatus Acidiferrales bacterium]
MKNAQFPIRAVLFDWDGTLLNSYEADLRAYLSMFHALGINWTERELALHYSPNWLRVYRAAELPRSKWIEADRLWTRAYKLEKPPLLAGARHIVRVLARKFNLGIVTSGNRPRVRRQLREFQLVNYFSACVCSEDASQRKPHPAPLQLALKRLRRAPEHCVYVGDTAEDIEMARRAGVRAIGVLGPFPTAARLRAAKPEVLLNSVQELPQYLRTMS